MNIASVLSDKGRQAIVTSPAIPIGDVARKLCEYRIGYLVVCDDANVVVGVLSERDIIRAIADRKDRVGELTVTDLMTPEPITCTPDDDPADVLRIMNQRGFRHMPVIEERKLKGIVSSRDIIKHLLEREKTDQVTMNKLNELGIY
jgi:CBS domain-containing protein